MEVTVVLGHGARTATSITVAGDLDVEEAATFGRLVMGIHDLLGSDATYDFTGVVARDDAGRSTLEMIAHEFREFGPRVTLPQLDAGPGGGAGGTLEPLGAGRRVASLRRRRRSARAPDVPTSDG